MKTQIKEFEVMKGFILSNAFAFTTIALTSYLKPNPGMLVYAEFIIIPLMMGLICAWSWREIEMRSKRMTGLVCLNGLIAIALSAVFLREGAICLIIVSPLIFAFIITGAFVGKAIFKRDNRTLNVSVFSVLLILLAADVRSVHHYENMVSDKVIVNATPSVVWKHVVAFERVEEENKFWLFKAGMPSPIAATVDGFYVGARRKCVFSNGYIFDEKMVVYQPGKNLTFDIVRQPRDPEIMGHIDILKGQFLLKDNGNGTTTLVGNSWYRLYVFPIWYYDVWAESITRNVHLRVMRHIKKLSERN
jgi:hypothetical protein